MKYKSSISDGLKVIAKVKFFVHAANANAHTRAMTLAPPDICPSSLMNRVSPLVINNLHMKFESDQANATVVSIMPTRFLRQSAKVVLDL